MGRSENLSRRKFVLIGLAPAQGCPHTPVQVQKLFFLLQARGSQSPALGHAYFDFKPCHFGPFDKFVYVELEGLQNQGWVEVSFDSSGLKNYRLTPEGQLEANKLLDELDSRSRKFAVAVSEWIHRQTFFNLLNTIYHHFPDMAVNSVFRS